MIEHRFRQSWLNTFTACPEQARSVRNGTAIDTPNSKTVRGTVVHETIEMVLNGRMKGSEATLDDALELVQIAWDTHQDSIVKWLDPPAKTLSTASDAVRHWYLEVFPWLNPVAVEQSFEFVLCEDENRRISLYGTRDLDEEDLTWDWKTGRHEPPWEMRRNAIQPTVYTLARAHERGDLESDQDFRFCYLANGKVEIIDVVRTPQDWAALVPLCNSIADLIEARLPSWPLRYDGWQCSDWCPNWGACRGRYLGVGSKPANW
jgi:hypothetical protein